MTKDRIAHETYQTRETIFAPETVRSATENGVFITGGGGTMMSIYLRAIGHSWSDQKEKPEVVIHYNSSYPEIVEEFPWFKTVQINFQEVDGIYPNQVLRNDMKPFGVYVFGAAGGYGDLMRGYQVDTLPHQTLVDQIVESSTEDYLPHVIFTNSYPGARTWQQMEEARLRMMAEFEEGNPKSLKVISDFLKKYNSTVAIAKWHTAYYAAMKSLETESFRFTNLVIPLIYEERRSSDRKQPMAQYLQAMIRGRSGKLNPFSEDGFDVLDILGGVHTNRRAAESLMYASTVPYEPLALTMEAKGMTYEAFNQEYPDI